MYFLGIFQIVAADPKAIVAARVPSPKAGGSELIFADKSQPPPPRPLLPRKHPICSQLLLQLRLAGFIFFRTVGRVSTM